MDIFIIGGGINGTAIAADAAGRGLSVTLCEKNDLASGTSSASTKLIHGGLRYLESYEFNLVKKALREREILLQNAPHLVSPLEFILPHEKHLRAAWMIRIGLFLYDHLVTRKILPKSKYINLINGGLKSQFTKGFSYYDCATDDARLTITNAIAAQEKGATILTQHEFISAQRENTYWKVQTQDRLSGEKFFYETNVLINAAGPWINLVQKNIFPEKLFNINLVKGSHIIVPKLYPEKFAYILQNKDHRIVFAIPYQNDFTLIGTTDVKFKNDLEAIEITLAEKNYLCETINQYFEKNISLNDIVWSYAGVRCLQASDEKKLSKITREYQLELDSKNNLLTVIGGKLTTYRTLAEDALNKLKIYFPDLKPNWTATATLPGGNFPEKNFENFYQKLKNSFPWLPDKLAYRYAKSYGTRAYLFLKDTHALSDLGEKFSAELYQKEIEYLINYEWAKTIDDILWRRTKLGLTISDEERKKLDICVK